MVRSCISILLSFSILLQGFNLHATGALEIQAMLRHMQEHQIEYGDDAFDFFNKHYGENRSEHDKEDHKGSDHHKKLPFKNLCQSNSGVLILPRLGMEKDALPVPVTTSPNFFYLDTYSFLEQSDIFQPPQVL